MEDDLSYAWKIAKILIPGSSTEIELAKITGGLGSKQIDPPKDATKPIGSDDRKDILQFLERLLDIWNQKIQAHHDISQLLIGQMTIGDQTGVTGMAGSGEDDKQLTVDGFRGKDETPADQIGVTGTVGGGDDKQLTVEGMRGKNETPSVSSNVNWAVPKTKGALTIRTDTRMVVPLSPSGCQTARSLGSDLF